MTTQDIEKVVKLTLNSLSLDKTINVDTIYIANQLGYFVYEADFNSEEEILSILNKDKKTIHINKYESFATKRFLIARSIAHIVLHDKNEHTYFKDSGKNDSQDFEADSFASMLLIPKQRIKQEWKLADYDIEKLTNFLNNVPKKAVLLRLISLGLIV